MNRLLRVALLVYPRQFRREYGSEWARTVSDLQVHSGYGTPRIAMTVVGETLTTAIRMRWENLMASAKIALMVIIGAVALITLMLGSAAVIPFFLALAALLALQFGGRERPVRASDLSASRRWYLWLAGAAAAFVVGLIALATDGDNELNTLQWTTWMASWALAVVFAGVGCTLCVSRLVANRR